MASTNKKRIILSFITLTLPICLAYTIKNYGNNLFNTTIKLSVLFVSIVLACLTIFFYINKPNKTYKILLISNTFLVSMSIMYILLYYHNLIYIFSSVHEFRKFILDTGNSGVIVYIIIQMLQVVILPIPAMVICLTGALIYGPLWGSIYCAIGVIIGSVISFWLGRTFGFKLVVWVSGKENAIKYASVLQKKGKTFLPMAFLLPLFPDDILCLIAGLTNMSFKYFFWVVLIFRPISIICLCFFGGGYIIPFRGWGLYVWGAVVVLMVFLVYVTTKYQESIENWFISKIVKK